MPVIPVSHIQHIMAFSAGLSRAYTEKPAALIQECVIKRPMEGILPYDEWAALHPGPASVTEEQEEDLMALGERELHHWNSYETAQGCINSSTREQSSGRGPWWQRRQK